MTRELLKSRQALPLELKETLSSIKIKEYYHRMSGKVYISFSGGKDSTVLLHLVRRYFPNVEAVFSDTGLEFPEIKNFVKTTSNVTWVKPIMPFTEVIKKYGYPVISKDVAQKVHEIRTTKSDKLRNKRLYGDEKGNGKISEKWKILIDAPFKTSHNCCNILKKNPIKKFEKHSGKSPIVGTMTEESTLRTTAYLQKGCNSFEGNRAMSTPIAFWTEKDIWAYIKKYNLEYSDIYNKGYDRTGCVFCMFGCHLEKGENRFQKLERTHPKLHNYCINKLGIKEVLDYIGVSYTTKKSTIQKYFSFDSRYVEESELDNLNNSDIDEFYNYIIKAA